MSDRPTCSTCGRFFKHEPGIKPEYSCGMVSA